MKSKVWQYFLWLCQLLADSEQTDFLYSTVGSVSVPYVFWQAIFYRWILPITMMDFLPITNGAFLYFLICDEQNGEIQQEKCGKDEWP